MSLLSKKAARILAFSCCVGGLLAAGYLSWALHRSSGSAIISDHLWPRSWPYPDAWLLEWQERLDAAHSTPADGIKIHGEWPRLHFYLCGWIGLSMVPALCGATGLVLLRRRPEYHASQQAGGRI